MFENGKKYLSIGTIGRSGINAWLAGFWMMVIGVLFGQMAISFGLFALVPELLSETSASPSKEQSFKFLQYTGLMLLGFVITVVGLFQVHKKDRFMPWGLILLIGMVIVMMCMTALSAISSGDSNANDLMMEILSVGPLTYGLALLGFVFPIFFLWFGSRIFHNRTGTSIITAWRKIRWGRIFFAAGLTILVLGTFTAVMHISGISKVRYMFGEYPIQRFLGYAAISLLLIPFQSAAEEIVFRGYLNQAFSRVLANKWIVFAITSALFAAMHLSNPEALSSAEGGTFEHLLMMSSYFFFGFILCVIVYFEGGLEAVIGIHAANNLFAAVFVNYEGSVLPTPSIFLAPAADGSSGLAIFIVLFLIGSGLYLTRQHQMEFVADAAIVKPDVQRL